MTAPSVALGWAFLIARGRRTGYRSILVPGFLVESNAYGVLGDIVGGDSPPSGSPRVVSAMVPAVGAITLAYQSQRLGHADLKAQPSPPEDTAVGDGADDPITDEHGRPLELLYGFVCRAPSLRATHEADLLRARAEALGAYRRFLADETDFSVAVSEPFTLQSVTADLDELHQPLPSPRDVAGPPRPPRGPARTQSLPARRRLRMDPIIVALVVVIASGIVWIALSVGPDTDVDVEEPESGVPGEPHVGCGTPNRGEGSAEDRLSCTDGSRE